MKQKKRPYGSGRVFLRDRIWWISYQSKGREIRRSSGSSDRQAAEAMLNKLVGYANRGVLAKPKEPVQDGYATWRLTLAELRALRGPIVYVLTSGQHVLYIGCSRHGLARPFASSHHILAKFDFTGPEELTVHCCSTVDEALALEERLIATLQPQLNRATREQRTLLRFTEEAGDDESCGAASDSECPDSVDTVPQD